MADINTDRIHFPAGKQEKFITEALAMLGYSTSELGAQVGYSQRMIRDWQRSKHSMPALVVEKICKLTGHSFPKGIIRRTQYAHIVAAASAGGKAVYKKYGGMQVDEINRQQQWQKWWTSKGKKQTILRSTKTILLPKTSVRLAEFTGIMMGDGGITKYQLTVTLNRRDDIEYSVFVTELFEELFGSKPSVIDRPKASVVVVTLSRTRAVEFCNKKLGLPIGHKIKQKLDIPKWILGDKDYIQACIRGLIDTDGCVVIETHRIKGKIYRYPRINFSSGSPALIATVHKLLGQLDFTTKLRRGGKAVQLENITEICKYFKVIGTNNPKHAARIKAFL